MQALVLDAGAVSLLSRPNSRAVSVLDLYVDDESMVPVVPSVVLVECLSGRQWEDALVNRFLKTCRIVEGPRETLARRAGALRAQAGCGSAVDAVVVAMAEPGGAVLTTDVKDLGALAAYARDVSVRGA